MNEQKKLFILGKTKEQEKREMSVSFSTVIQRLRPRPNAGTNALSEYLAKLAPTTLTALPNGVRVASEQGRGEFATIGVYLDAGSRYEPRSANGSAAVLQRICLQGTTNQTRGALASAIDELGGHMSAYTTRDRTAFYVKCLKDDVPRAVTLLAELVRNPKITDESVETARKQLLKELKDNDDNQDLQVMDNLHTAAYDSTEYGLGANPLGTPETVKNIGKEQVLNYRSENWNANRVLVVGAGAVNHAQLEGLAKQNFGDMTSGNKRPKPDSRFVGGDIKFWNLRQKVTHLTWAFETCGADCGDVVPLTLVNHIYGRWHRQVNDLTNHSSQIAYKNFTSMDHSTPTNRHFPEKGLELMQPFYSLYEDTGLLGLHIVCRPEDCGGSATNMWDYIQYTMGDLCRLTQKICAPHELEQAKVNYKATLLMALDGPTNNAEDIATQVLLRNRRVPIEEMFARIDDVTPTNMMETLQHYYYSRRPVLSHAGYVYQTPSYDQVIHWTYKYLF